MRAFAFLAFLLAVVAGPVRADVVELESCTDARGGTVPGESDPSLAVLVRAEGTGGRRVIRYNPNVLPRLSLAARQFFFAQECAKLDLGLASGTEVAVRWARQADCVAVGTLRAAGIVDGAPALQALQAELVFSDDDWERIPGPRRSFDLAACSRQSGVIALPVGTPPSAGQAIWDACVRQCGDRLFHCQGGCRSADCQMGCQGTYDRCEAACTVR